MDPEPRQPSRDHTRAWGLLVLVLLVAVYGPLFGAGPIGEDFSVLAESSRAVHPELGGTSDIGADLLYARAGTDGRPLAALSLGTTGWLWTQAGIWTPFALAFLRLENLLLLLVTAYFLGRFVRRLVVPWTGIDQAAAAGHAAWLFLVIHPLSVSAVASPVARGDLLGGLFAVTAGAAFLRGRQERRYSLVALAAILTFAATLSSELGYLLPFWLSLIEYYSSRRYRPGRVRLRTALTTLVVFGAFSGLDVLLRLVQGVPAWPHDLELSLAMILDFGDVWIAALHALEKLGVLMVPVNGAGEGGIGYVLAVLVLVVVIQPALHAGRSAPRFWATMLSAWLTIILMTVSIRSFTRVAPGAFTDAAGLFPAVLVMAIGLGLAATAVTGKRRLGIPVVVALMLCVLARGNAEGLRAAADEGLGFQHQVGDIIAEGGADQQYLIVDPPESVGGYRVLPRELEQLFDLSVGFQPLHSTLVVRSLTAPALMAFTREPEFDVLRRSGLVIVLRRSREVAPEEGEVRAQEVVREVGRWRGQALELAGVAPAVVGWSNTGGEGGEPRQNPGRGHWSGVAGDVPYLADSATIEQITVDVPADSEGELDLELELEETPAIFWRARGGLTPGGELRGVWLRREGGRRAVFDPGGSLEWLLGPRVDSLLLIGALADAAGAEVRASPPAVAGVEGFEVRDEDWWFAPREDDESLLWGAQSEWSVTLFDLADLRYVEVECELDEELEGVLAEDVEELVRHFWSGRARLAWALERRVDGVLISRSGGRL